MEHCLLVTLFLFLTIIGACENYVHLKTNFVYFSKDHPNAQITKNHKLGPNAKVYFYIHGWKSKNLEDAVGIKNAIFANKNDVDIVILVDWTEASMNYNFTKVAFDTIPKVAMNLANELKALSKEYGISAANVQMAGHCLGAHIMGQAGKIWNKNELVSPIKQMTGKN